MGTNGGQGWTNVNEGVCQWDQGNESGEQEQLKGAGEWEWMNESGRMRAGECE